MRNRQRRLVLASALLPIAVGMWGCGQAPAEDAAEPVEEVAAAQTPEERGEVLVTVGGCHDCHTPKIVGPNGPEPDMSRALSGHPEDVEITAGFETPEGSPYTIHTIDHLTAWSGAWGVSFAANLTPDPETGWTLPASTFIAAMRFGAHLGSSRDILPPMPWQMYAMLSDEDLRAIHAYLRTLTPIRNQVPEPIPPPQ